MKNLSHVYMSQLGILMNVLSQAQMLGKKSYYGTDFVAADQRPLDHQGHHRVVNPRYKEWWYFDFHLNNGMVISSALVLSIVKDHFFVWIHCPKTGQILIEREEDADFTISPLGSNTLHIQGEKLCVQGQGDFCYEFSFTGKFHKGFLRMTNPLPARGEKHLGTEDTFYGLYQIPRWDVEGKITNIHTQESENVQGSAYADHWWGIIHRRTHWHWTQVKFPSGHVVSFYSARYDKNLSDIHRYAWLFNPLTGSYEYFDKESLKFEMPTSQKEWKIEALRGNKKIILCCKALNRRFEHKPVKLGILPVGYADYFQYPVEGTAEIWENSTLTQKLEGGVGLLEWDWNSLW